LTDKVKDDIVRNWF